MKSTRGFLLLIANLTMAAAGPVHAKSGLEPFLLVQHTDDGAEVCTNPPQPEGTHSDRTIFVSHGGQGTLIEAGRMDLMARVHSGPLCPA